MDHKAWPLLLNRTLRLNCLTSDYSYLWESLYSPAFEFDRWTAPFAELASTPQLDSEWSWGVPYRSDFDRRSALVEIDALVAIMLGLTSDQLSEIFRSQFPVLRKYESEMYFDAEGSRIARDHQVRGGVQRKDDYRLLKEFEAGSDCEDLLERYKPFAPAGERSGPWFYRADREAEMRAAYADFEQRLASA